MMARSQNTKETHLAGTGFMLQLCEAISYYEEKGYKKNITAHFDHFEVDSGAMKFFPEDFVVDDIFRFENSSDPDDQAIIYAISCNRHGIKGLYIEPYGIYQHSFSDQMMGSLCCRRYEPAHLEKAA